ncbi:hypothetical protein CsSME_00037382 [Camellia sinensis var. sinensis]
MFLNIGCVIFDRNHQHSDVLPSNPLNRRRTSDHLNVGVDDVETTAESHGDCAGGDLGDAGGEDDGGGSVRTGETSGESEGDGEAVRDADDNVVDDLARCEVLLGVLRQKQLL